MLKTCWLRIVLLSCTLGPLAAAAQPALRPRFQEAVSIRVDNEATKSLLTIGDRWAAGHWADALDDLISLAESRPAAIVQVEWGEDAGVSRYQPVSAAVERWLETLSAEGRTRYRKRVDPPAQQLWRSWESTRDPTVLQLLVERYFYSGPASAALWELGQAAWLQGDLASARYWWGLLLPADSGRIRGPSRRYPDPAQPAADIAARVVLCDLLAASPEGAAELASFREQFPNAAGSLGGKEGLWVDLLEEVTAAVHRPPHIAAAADVPTFAGAGDRASSSAGMLDLGGELWSVALPSAVVPRTSMPLLHPVAPPLAYYPAVVDDVVYLNDGSRIFAWNLYSGTPAWDPQGAGSAMIYPPLSPDPPLAPRRPVRGNPLWTVTVGNGRLYASLGSVVTTPTPIELREPASELVCLDIAAGEGRLLWSISSSEISSRVQALDADAPSWMWEGTPLLLGTRLYGALSRRRPQLEWSVACLDAESGQLLWHRPVGMSRPTPPDQENLATHLLLSAGHGRLYLSTNWGAVAALDVQDGNLQWAVNYQSQPRTNSWRRAGTDLAPPCLVTSKYVYVAPTDSGTVMCLDAQSGRLVWPSPASIDEGPIDEPIEHLLGVKEGCLVAAGASLWGLDAETGGVRWSVRPGDPELQGYGRGWIAGEAVYWPSQAAIQVVDPGTGALLREKPLMTPDVQRMGGHLVQTGGVLLVASHNRLSAYGEYGRLREATENWLSQSPEDLRGRLRLAELAILGNDPAAADRQWEFVCRSTDSFPGRRASARRLTTKLRPPGLPGAVSRQDFAGVRTMPLVPQHRTRALAWEVEQAQDVDWQIDALHRWVQHQARSPPVPDVMLTRVLGEMRLHELRRKAGAAAFARFDAVAKERLDQLDDASHSAPRRVVQRDFPTSPAASAVSSPRTPEPVTAADVRELTTTASAAGYWKLAWQRSTPPGARVVLASRSSTNSVGVPLLIAGGDTVAAWDRKTGQSAWTTAVASMPLWADSSECEGLVATQEELFAVSWLTGNVSWRVPCRASVEPGLQQWWLTDKSLIQCDPQREVRALDLASGDVRWHNNLATAPWHSLMAWSKYWIIAQQAATSQVLVVSTRDGTRTAAFPATRRPWIRSPVVSSAADEVAMVDDQRVIAAWSMAGELRLGATDSFAAAHADPWVFHSDEHWYVVVDAQRLSEFRPSGRVGASVPLSSIPIRNSPKSTCLTDGLLIVATPAQLSGVDLRAMSTAWRAEGAFGPTHLIFPLPETNEFVQVVGPTVGAAPLTLAFRNAQTGRLLQTLTLPESETDATEIAADESGLLLKTSSSVLRLERVP
ncbi:MAG: PQQ-binding-like beta-propeller repeat protein [Planctomycetaceae bacterium]|nr:PQQ-binding-like beta-propeller repeat protein [Planctomycetaceae bacterium]